MTDIDPREAVRPMDDDLAQAVDLRWRRCWREATMLAALPVGWSPGRERMAAAWAS